MVRKRALNLNRRKGNGRLLFDCWFDSGVLWGLLFFGRGDILRDIPIVRVVSGGR